MRLVLLRGIIWSLIGLIYAPLFTGFADLGRGLGWGLWSYVAAAAAAGAIGAALYGARQMALIGTALGMVVGLGTLLFLGDRVGLPGAVLAAAGVAGGLGLLVRFPDRCSRHVPAKALTGLLTGALCGVFLAVAEPLHAQSFPIFVVLAFMVSVNGVLYVSTVRGVIGLLGRLPLRARPCDLIEAAVMAVLAALATGSIWMVVGPLLNLPSGLLFEVSNSLHAQLPMAMLGGLVGGGVAGILLQLFRFSWVHDV